MKPLAIALCISALLPLNAQATDYTQLQADKSSINFAYTQMGVAMAGTFRKFSAQMNFDPGKPSTAKTTFVVELASVDTGSSEADQEVAGKPWFNTRAFPTARFVSSSVKPLGGNRFEVAGKLSIKNQTQDIIIPATFSTQGNNGIFDGHFTIQRADFSIGEGAWAKFDVVANDIRITFHLTANSGH